MIKQRVDFGIIGAGLSGSLLASLLARKFPSANIALVDPREQLQNEFQLNERSVGMTLSPRGIHSIKLADISQDDIG